ncbi:hypothetical protein [Parenemella sanctibonifatiensis]|uniref:Uncharacterized protein n=1 Tax=Parenemella sanctibonifatiensis TaxID=2016505 RepID=A0A255EGD9_9ACTN|nr:hypothetical protein [Parenemella sanctibonifatiensis]OYN90594.1 hypothetical protein CGZ92_00910 [Parenemella sanctibonifatiensis]
MTESTAGSPSEYETIEAARAQARQQATTLERTISLQFSDAWGRGPGDELPGVRASFEREPGVVTLHHATESSPWPDPVTVTVDLSTGRELPARLSTMRGGTLSGGILSVSEAADQLGLDVDTTRRAVTAAVELVQVDIDQHRTLHQLHDNIETLGWRLNSTEEAAMMRQQHREDMARDAVWVDPADAAEAQYASWDAAGEEPTSSDSVTEDNDRAGVTPEWGTDPVGEPYTPERVAAIWIQATSTVDAYLASDRPIWHGT